MLNKLISSAFLLLVLAQGALSVRCGTGYPTCPPQNVCCGTETQGVNICVLCSAELINLNFSLRGLPLEFADARLQRSALLCCVSAACVPMRSPRRVVTGTRIRIELCELIHLRADGLYFSGGMRLAPPCFADAHRQRRGSSRMWENFEWELDERAWSAASEDGSSPKERAAPRRCCSPRPGRLGGRALRCWRCRPRATFPTSSGSGVVDGLAFEEALTETGCTGDEEGQTTDRVEETFAEEGFTTATDDEGAGAGCCTAGVVEETR
ncbi:hypothetical protein B0H19DRAFT_1257560 [Mycena capillaripes]|nr:hypothetical protein B0H19DRAFT_1257560 [Mycena capillaripes]